MDDNLGRTNSNSNVYKPLNNLAPDQLHEKYVCLYEKFLFRHVKVKIVLHTTDSIQLHVYFDVHSSSKNAPALAGKHIPNSARIFTPGG